MFQVLDVLAAVRRSTPLVHCMTNTVVPEITANVLLAAGADVMHRKDGVAVAGLCRIDGCA